MSVCLGALLGAASVGDKMRLRQEQQAQPAQVEHEVQFLSRLAHNKRTRSFAGATCNQGHRASSFDCTVGNCHIRHLCTTADRELVYYMGARDLRAIAHNTSTQATATEFPKMRDSMPYDSADPSRLSDLHLHPGGTKHSVGKMLPVAIALGCIPSGVNFQGGVTVAINRLYVPYLQGVPNPGHTLGDEVMSIFRSMQMWTLLDQNVSVYTNDLRAAKMYGFLRLSQPVALLSSLPAATCFENLLVGWRNLGYMVKPGRDFQPPQMPRLELTRFRDYVQQRFRIAPPPHPHPPRVLLLQKDVQAAGHKNFIDNLGALATQLRDSMHLQVSIVSWSGMPLRQQITLLAATDVMFSLGGSDIMNAIFLPTRAALVIPFRRKDLAVEGAVASERRDNGMKWHGPSDIRLWFQFRPSLHIILYK